MRANLADLAKVMRAISDERAREILRTAEAEAGEPPEGFVDAEECAHDEYWATADRLGLPVPPGESGDVGSTRG